MKIGGKYGIAIAFISIMLTGVVMFKLGVFGVSANPDYICTKNLSNQECIIDESTCTGWSGGQRTCTGQRTTSIWYKHVRTSCPSGRSQRGNGSAGGASGRHSPDYENKESCNIIQTDTTNAEGVLEIE